MIVQAQTKIRPANIPQTAREVLLIYHGKRVDLKRELPLPSRQGFCIQQEARHTRTACKMLATRSIKKYKKGVKNRNKGFKLIP